MSEAEDYDLSEDLYSRLKGYLNDNLRGPALVAFRYQEWRMATLWANIMQLKDTDDERYQTARGNVERTLRVLRATCQDLGI